MSTSNLVFMDELRNAFCEHFGENWLCYKEVWLYKAKVDEMPFFSTDRKTCSSISHVFKLKLKWLLHTKIQQIIDMQHYWPTVQWSHHLGGFTAKMTSNVEKGFHHNAVQLKLTKHKTSVERCPITKPLLGHHHGNLCDLGESTTNMWTNSILHLQILVQLIHSWVTPQSSPDLNLTPLAAFLRFLPSAASLAALGKKRKKAARGVRFKSGLSTELWSGKAGVGKWGTCIYIYIYLTVTEYHNSKALSYPK